MKVINISPITKMIFLWKTHHASTLAKIITLPALIPLMIFFLIKKNIIIVMGVTILVFLTGCAGWTWEDEMAYRNGGAYGIIQAQERQAEAAEWQTIEMQRQTWLLQEQAQPKCTPTYNNPDC